MDAPLIESGIFAKTAETIPDLPISTIWSWLPQIGQATVKLFRDDLTESLHKLSPRNTLESVSNRYPAPPTEAMGLFLTCRWAHRPFVSLIHVFHHCAIQYKPSVCWLRAVNWHITDCRPSVSHRRNPGELVASPSPRWCQRTISQWAASSLWKDSKLKSEPRHIPTIQAAHAAAGAYVIHPVCVDLHKHKDSTIQKMQKTSRKWGKLHTLHIYTHRKTCTHTHTHILPTDKTQLWTQSRAPASTASSLLLTDRT